MVITGEQIQTTVAFADFEKYEDQIITVKGTIHNIRMMSDFAFVILRTAREMIQCVYAESFSDYRMTDDVKEECAAKITGKVVAGETKDGSKRYELQIHGIELLSHPAEIPPDGNKGGNPQRRVRGFRLFHQLPSRLHCKSSGIV